VIGWINLILAGLGYCQLAVNVVGYYSLPKSFIDEYGPFMRGRFPAMSMVAAFLLAGLAIAGFMLLRKKKHAIEFCSAFFLLEIIVITIACARWRPFFVVSPLVIWVGLMNGAIALQIVTLYPVLALVTLHLKRSTKVVLAQR